MLKRPVLLHMLIISLFCVYMLSANYIFDNLLPASGEYKFEAVDVSGASSDIELNVELLKEETLRGDKYLHIDGWVFVKSDKAKNKGKVYLVLDDGAEKKGLIAKLYFRADLDEYFNRVNAGSTRDNGFYLMIPNDSITDGKYRLGIYIDDGGKKYFIDSDRYITKTGEGITVEFISSPQKIKLPVKGDSVKHNFESIIEKEIDGKKYLKITGWAFTEPFSPLARKNIVLEAGGVQHVFDTAVETRADIAKYFGRQNDGLENCGFKAYIPVGAIKAGAYAVGIYIDDQNNKSFTSRDRYITKMGEGVTEGFISTPQQIRLPVKSDKVKHNVESVTKKQIGGKSYLHISGWAFTETIPLGGSKRVVLNSGGLQYVFDTVAVARPDVAKYFKRLNDGLENCGFKSIIPADLIKDGVYEVGVILGDEKNMSFSSNGTTIDTNKIIYSK